jgi:myo-inositol-1(or 4)-monophosphatase
MSSPDLQVALEAARAGAEVVSGAFGRGADPSFKTSDVDPVTATDKASEDAILAVLRTHRPGDQILAEESGGAAFDDGRVWIADPLDGTVNFVHGFPPVAVSVALWENGHPRAGVVIDITRGEEFSASAGEGALLDGVPISVSGQTEIARSLIATGFPYDRQRNAERYGRVLSRVLSRAQGVRRAGSAALDMCYVAAGRLDGYWEFGLGAWDAAASLLIVSEAGGVWTGYGGGEYRLGSGGVVVTNGRIHDVMVDTVGDGE